MKKITFEGDFGHAKCIDHYVDMIMEYVKQDVEKELRQITGKYVRITIEELPDPRVKATISAMPQMAVA